MISNRKDKDLMMENVILYKAIKKKRIASMLIGSFFHNILNYIFPFFSYFDFNTFC